MRLRITENHDIQHLVAPVRGITTWMVDLLMSKTFPKCLMLMTSAS